MIRGHGMLLLVLRLDLDSFPHLFSLFISHHFPSLWIVNLSCSQGFLRQKISGQGLAFIVGGGSGMFHERQLLLQWIYWGFYGHYWPAFLLHIVIIFNLCTLDLERKNNLLCCFLCIWWLCACLFVSSAADWMIN